MTGQVRCIRPCCNRVAMVNYNPVDAPKGWKGWLCGKHRDQLYDQIARDKLREDERDRKS